MRIVPESDPILGWHFVGANLLLHTHGQTIDRETRRVAPGYVYSEVGGEIRCCRCGMHASTSALDALGYSPGPIVCRVALWGEIDEDWDKLAARHREVLWMADAARELRLFACWCKREAPASNGGKLWDRMTRRERAAVGKVERYAQGKADEDGLLAAQSAAWIVAQPDATLAASETARHMAMVSADYATTRSAQRAELERRLLALAPEGE